MKPNYKVWEINPRDFVVKNLQDLLGFAVLAPSSHNSQPWKFIAQGQEITIRPNFERELSASDVNHRQLYISLGCALENLLVAADYYNFDATVTYNDNGVTIFFQKQSTLQKHGENHLIFAIPRRHTNRNAYRDQIPDQQFLNRAKSHSRDDICIDFVLKQEEKDKIADIVNEALIFAMDDKKFRRELSQYVKANTTASPIGMPGFGFGAPTPISLLAPTLLRYLNVNKMTKKKDEELLKNQTPVFGIISTQQDDHASWMQAGQLYERVALEAEQQNMKTQPLAAVIQMGDFYRKLQDILQVASRPQFFFRLGYTDSIPLHSPRLASYESLTNT
jgi:hypothetical protein